MRRRAWVGANGESTPWRETDKFGSSRAQTEDPKAEDFGIREADVPPIADGEFLVQNHYLSSDPAASGWIADAGTYWPRIEIGDTIRAFAVGEIVESRNPHYSVGEKVMGLFGWQEYAAASDKHVNLKIAPSDLPLSLYLGVLGLNGFTGYFGLLDIGAPEAGDTVVVSTAAGAVGSPKSRGAGQ